MDVWGKVLGLLNKPLNCTSLSLYLFPRELGYATYCRKKLSSRDSNSIWQRNTPPTFTCQCGKVFKSQRGLKSDEMLHTGGIKCGLCPFEGTHGEQTRAHRRSQHGADRLQCSQCFLQPSTSSWSQTILGNVVVLSLVLMRQPSSNIVWGDFSEQQFDCKFNLYWSIICKQMIGLVDPGCKTAQLNTTTLLCRWHRLYV